MNALIVIILGCAAWAVTAAVLIARDLERRGQPVSFLWLRFMILRHLSDYGRITAAETGHVGPLFYHYVVPLNVALVLAVVMVLTSL